MKTKTLTTLFLILTIAVKSQNSVFPLQKGNCWIYEGVVKWQPINSKESKQKEVKWKMEITEVMKRGEVVAAVVKGHPLDLVWYNDSTTRGDYLIVSIDDKNYYLVQEQRFFSVMNRLKDTNDDLRNLVEEDELFLSFPLTKGKAFGGASEPKSNGFNSWFVEDEIEAGNEKQFMITFRSNPDYISLTFVPSIGITKYKYHHNGTISEVDLILTEKNINN